jgi:hypothetical protein
MCTGKELEAHKVEKGRLSLRQWCTTSQECSVRLDKGRKSESSYNEPSQNKTLLYFFSKVPLYRQCFLSIIMLCMWCSLSRIILYRLLHYFLPWILLHVNCFVSRISLYFQSHIFSVEKLVEIGKKILTEKCADMTDVRYDTKSI